MFKKIDQGEARKLSLGLFKEFLKRGAAKDPAKAKEESKSLLEKASALGIKHGKEFIKQLKDKDL
jgi:hypothetical protein